MRKGNDRPLKTQLEYRRYDRRYNSDSQKTEDTFAGEVGRDECAHPDEEHKEQQRPEDLREQKGLSYIRTIDIILQDFISF